MSSKWDVSMKDDLLQALYSFSPPSSAEQKKQIAAYLADRGHTITWDAIRPKPQATSTSIMSINRQNWDAPGLYRDLVTELVLSWRPSREQIQGIVDDMNKRGYLFTFHGLNQHLQKLRRTAGEPGSAPATPKGPKAPKAPKAPKTPKGSGGRKRSAKKACEESDSMDGIDMESGSNPDELATPPSKRAKTEAQAIKKESLAEKEFNSLAEV